MCSTINIQSTDPTRMPKMYRSAHKIILKYFECLVTYVQHSLLIYCADAHTSIALSPGRMLLIAFVIGASSFLQYASIREIYK